MKEGMQQDPQAIASNPHIALEWLSDQAEKRTINGFRGDFQS